MLDVIRRDPHTIPGNHPPRPDRYPQAVRGAIALYRAYRPATHTDCIDQIMQRNVEGSTLATVRQVLERYSPADLRKKDLRSLEWFVRMVANSCYKSAKVVAQRLHRRLVSYGFSYGSLFVAHYTPPSSTPGTAISARTLATELELIALEFPRLTVHIQNQYLEVLTDPITLEGHDLGEFRIRVPFVAMANGLISEVRIDGVDPAKAATGTDGQNPHPHILGGHVCWGDGARPAAKFLREGKLAAFCLTVRSLLETYNDGSPYVAMEVWRAERRARCNNCEAAIGDDDIATCDSCEEEYCHECSVSPQPCEAGDCSRVVCRSCRVRCERCHKHCCRNCRVSCNYGAYCPDCVLRCACGRTQPKPSGNDAAPADFKCQTCITAEEMRERMRREAEARQRKQEEEAAERRRVAEEARERAHKLAQAPEQLAVLNRIRADLGLPPLDPATAAQNAAAVLDVPQAEPAPEPTPYIGCICHDCLEDEGRLDLCKCELCTT